MNDRTRDQYERRPVGFAMETATLSRFDAEPRADLVARDRDLDETEDVLERARQRVEDAMDGRGRRPRSDSDDQQRQDAAPDSSRGER